MARFVKFDGQRHLILS